MSACPLAYHTVWYVMRVVAIIIGGIASLHLAWALGSAWPARDKQRLAAAVLGRQPMPSRLACAVVAMGLGTMVYLLLTPQPLWVRYGIAAIFLARGSIVAGIVGGKDEPYVTYNRYFYTPLSLGLGLAILIAS